MKIKEITWQHRRDFSAIYECEHCGATQENNAGYDDDYYHQNVIPEMKCESCDKKAKDDYVKVTEVSPESVKNTKGLCVCDKCKKTFNPAETLMDKCDNLEFQGLLGVKGITKGKNTWYLVSPCCHETHLFGFDMKQ